MIKYEGGNIMKPQKIKFYSLIIMILLILVLQVPYVSAANIYVDKALASNCTAGNYSTTNRTCSGSDGNAYTTIQAAINNCSVGDSIFMRGGTYKEIGIDIPESKNGTAWTNGYFTTLSSYSGEWAIIDGTGLNTTSDWTRQAIITHPTGYDVQSSALITKYWKFERFEVTGGRAGFFLKGGPMWFRYLYIHNNGRDYGDSIQAGILIPIGMDNIIEYCWFKDNFAPDGASQNANNSNILIDADYRDTSDNGGNGLAFDSNLCIKNNEIRYNLIEGSFRGIRHKNQQRFGYNNRNPNDMTYKNYGDKIHHNIVLNAGDASIVIGQDFIQIYNNITDNSIESTQNGDMPATYNSTIYNNTVIGTHDSFLLSSGLTQSGSSFLNYYDSGSQQTVHPHVYFYNNISSGTGSGWHELPFILAWDMPPDTSNPDRNWSNLVVDHNFVHSNSQGTPYLVGHQTTGATCVIQTNTTTQFNSCSATWRGIGTVLNWENSNSGLFVGSSGADKYKTNGSFVIGSTTIKNGGIGGNHPYLTGKILPSYVGATNPNDPKNNAWVDGVLSLSNTEVLKEGSKGAPWWSPSIPSF